MGRKIVLIKSILASILIYLLIVIFFWQKIYLLIVASHPKVIFRSLESSFANFLWGSIERENKYYWIIWKDLYVPEKKGRVGFQALEEVFQHCP